MYGWLYEFVYLCFAVQERTGHGGHVSSRTHSPVTVGLTTSQSGVRYPSGASSDLGRRSTNVITSSQAVTPVHDSVQPRRSEHMEASVYESSVGLDQRCVETGTAAEDVFSDSVAVYRDMSTAAELPDSPSAASNQPQSDISSVVDDDDDDEDYEDDDVIVISSSSPDDDDDLARD